MPDRRTLMLGLLGLGLTDCAVRQRPGGGTPTPTPTPSGPDAPILSNLATGWTTGQNPPAWQSAYPNVQGYNSFDGTGDQVRAHYKLGAGAWTATAWEPLDDELATGDAPAWPFLTDGSLAAGGAFQVWEEIVRDLGLGTEQTSAASNTWSDTIGAPVEAASAWVATTGNDKSTFVTVNGTGNLVFTGPGGGFNNAPCSARATQGRSGKRQFQVTLTNVSGSKTWLGIDDSTTPFDGSPLFKRPGKDNSAGISFAMDGFDWWIYAGGAQVQTGSTTPANGDVVTCTFDTAAGTASFYRTRSGTTTQFGSAQAVTMTSWIANVGGEAGDIATAKFGTGQARNLDSGYVPYDN